MSTSGLSHFSSPMAASTSSKKFGRSSSSSSPPDDLSELLFHLRPPLLRPDFPSASSTESLASEEAGLCGDPLRGRAGLCGDPL